MNAAGESAETCWRKGKEHKKHKRHKKSTAFLVPFVLLVFLPLATEVHAVLQELLVTVGVDVVLSADVLFKARAFA